jgi:subfamily B ATP-binding cassette protein MsbA
MTSKSLYLRLLHYVIPYWRIFALAIFAIIVMALTDPILAALIQPLLDGGFVEKDPATIKLIPLLLMLLIVVKGLAMLASSVGMKWVAAHLVMDLRREMFEKILTLPSTEFDKTSSGVLLSKVTYDVNRVMAAATDALVILIRDTLIVIGLLAWMFYLNWKLSLIVFSIVPLMILVIRFVSKRLRNMNTSMQDAMGQMTRVLEETIIGHKLVKVFGGHKYEHQRFHKASNQVQHLEVKTQLTSGLSVFIVQLLTGSVLGIIIYIAAVQSASENITVGAFVSLFTAMGMLFAPIKHLTKINEQLQQGLAAAQSIFALIDQVSEPDKAETESKKFNGQLSFNNITFSYEDQKIPALQEISLDIKAGETIAFVGKSGSGKTTIANLIPRFYNITKGSLLLDGININQLSLATLRENIALVSQEVVLFNDSIAANIAYGAMAGASRDKIIKAATSAYAMEFIEQMPQGLDTVIGERGVKLSGGQRQRLAIARALLKDAAILIFDEATAALDNNSESQVQQSLEQLKQGRTTLIIAHRLSTIVNADRIIVMENGRIVEIGTHSQLITNNWIYANLYQNELGNSIR